MVAPLRVLAIHMGRAVAFAWHAPAIDADGAGLAGTAGLTPRRQALVAALVASHLPGRHKGDFRVDKENLGMKVIQTLIRK